MTVLSYQQALAKVLTDSDWRKNILAQQKNFFESKKIAQKDLMNLLRLDGEAVAEYSKMLLATRLNTVLNVLPETKKLLPSDFMEKIIWDYEEKEPASRTNGSPTLEEVKRFAGYLEKTPEVFASFSLLLQDICRYEIACFLVQSELFNESSEFLTSENEFSTCKIRVNPNVRILRFNYPIPQVISVLKTGNKVELQPKKTILLFLPTNKKIKVKIISEIIYAILENCNGKLSIAEICQAETEKLSSSVSDFEVIKQTISKTLRNFAELGILIPADCEISE